MMVWFILFATAILIVYFLKGHSSDPTRKFARQVASKKHRLQEKKSLEEQKQRTATQWMDLRPVRGDEDMELLRNWLHQEHVRRWWGDPETAVREARQRPSENHRIITFREHDCGYVCWERPDPKELADAGLTRYADGLIDVDILIGRLDLLGCGIGTAVGKQLLQEIGGPETQIGVGMSVDNRRALRTAKQLGFEVVHTYDDPDSGRCHYMLLSR